MDKSVLIIGPHRPAHDLLNPLWSELELEKQRFTSTEAALEMIQGGEVPSVVLVSYPLWDSSLDDLLAAMGRSIPVNQPVPIVVLAPENALLEVAAFEDQGVTVLSEGKEPDDLYKSLHTLFSPERRAHPRFIVRMAVRVGDGAVLRACQSEDISVSGMLIRTSEEFPVGSRVRLEFALSEDGEPLVCIAEVVRYARPEAEKARGMGVNFMSFEEEGWTHLKNFLSA